MTEFELEQRLRAWYRDEIGFSEPAPDALRGALETIAVTYPRPVFGSRRSLVLLAAAVVLLVAAIGAAIVLNQPTPFPRPGPGPTVQNGLIAFTSAGDSTSTLYVVAPDGTGLTEVPGVTPQGSVSWSPEGARAAFVDGATLKLMDADGSSVTVIAESSDGYADVAWSPNGTRIAFSEWDGQGWDIFVMNLDGTGLQQLTDGPGLNLEVAWSPDGSQVLFAREVDLGGDAFESSLHVINADGTNERQLTDVASIVGYAAWSPDGSQIAFSRRSFPPSGQPSSYNPPWDIWIMDADGANQGALTTNPDWSELNPTWSPDGTLIAFAGNASDGFGIYVMNRDGTEIRRIAGPVLVGGWPSWAVAVDEAN